MAIDEDKLLVYLNERFEKVESMIGETNNKVDEFKDQMYTRMDKIIGEVASMRETLVIHEAKHEQIDEDLAAIKAIPAIAHELSR